MSGKVGPSVVTDNLIFAVDVANLESHVSGSTLWKDQTPNGNDGTLTNGPTFSSIDGGILEFDGSDDYIEFGSIDSSNLISLFGQPDYSIDMWLAPNFEGDDFQRVIEKSSAGSSADGWGVILKPSTQQLYFFIDGHTIGNYTDSAANAGSWRHYTWTREGDSVIKLYINGELVYEATSARSIPSNTANIRIGSWNHSTGREYNGKIANIKIYNKELSAAEVLQNYNALKNRFV